MDHLAGFRFAIRTARPSNVPEIQNIQILGSCLDYSNRLLHWIPTEALQPEEPVFHLSISISCLCFSTKPRFDRLLS
ncbi:hypothetical protein BDV18DRAFT_116020 [Aspergillus unguis]